MNVYQKTVILAQFDQLIEMRENDRVVLQNLGPDKVFFGGPTMTAANGFELVAGQTYEFPHDLESAGYFGGLWVTSAGTSDLRYGPVGVKNED